jgi:hypothetical protein
LLTWTVLRSVHFTRKRGSTNFIKLDMFQLTTNQRYRYDGQYKLWQVVEYDRTVSLLFFMVLAADQFKTRPIVGKRSNGCRTTGGHLQKSKMKRRKKTRPTATRTTTDGVHAQVVKTEHQQCATRWVSALSLGEGLLALQDQALAAIFHFSSYPTMAPIIQLPRARPICREG